MIINPILRHCTIKNHSCESNVLEMQMVICLLHHFSQGGSNAQTFFDAAVALDRKDILRNINFKPDLLLVEAR